MAVDTAGVNVALAALPSQIGKRAHVVPDSDLLTDDPGDTGSDNWPLVGAANRLWNAINGFQVDKSLAEQRDWWKRFFAVRKFMRGEQLSAIYFPHHCEPVLAARAAFSALGNSDLVADAGEWLRAAAGYLVLGAANGRCFDLAEREHNTPGPGLFVGRQAPISPLAGLRPIVWAGHRCAVQEGLRRGAKGWGWSMPVAPAPRYLAAALCERSLELIDACKARGVWSSWLTNDEVEIAKRAILNDVVALRQVVDWIRPWPLDHPTIFDRAAAGVATILLDGKGGSTASCELATWTPTSASWAVANNGGREPQNVHPTHTLVDWTQRTATAQRDDKSLGAVRGALPEGPSLFRVLSGQGKVEIEIGGPAGTEPAPTPGARRIAELLTLCSGAGCGGANAADVGSITGISPLEGEAGLFVVRKGAGMRPWSTETIHARADGSLALLCEVGYDPQGGVRNVRTFWDPNGRPGVAWLPALVEPGRFDSEGWAVFNNVSGSSEGLPTHTSPTPAIQHSKVSARCELVPTGNLGAAGFGPGFVRRDSMGLAPHVNVEEYGFGISSEGLFPYVTWRNFVEGSLVGEAAAAVRQPLGAALKVFTLFPDGSEGWAATPGFAGAIDRSRKPSVVPERTGGSSSSGGKKKGGGCVVILLALFGAAAASAWVVGW